MNCYKCKHPNLHGSNFCEKCGADLKAPPPPKVVPVRPYGGAAPPPGRYHTPARPTPAPRPSPAPKPSPAGSGYNPPQVPPPASPAPPPSQPPVPREPRRSPVVSKAPEPASPPPRTRRDPLPFCRLSAAGGQEFLLRYDSNLVGRASPGEGINPQVDLTAIDTSGTVSRRHARIGKDDSAAAFVEDLGSSNGTRHNGQTLRAGMQTPLADGDQLIFGDVVFTFHFISSSG